MIPNKFLDYSYINMSKEFQINVFSSSNPAVISVAKSLLDDAGVVYYLNIKENGTEEKKIITEINVTEDQFQKARSLLVELEELDFDVC